MIFSTGMFISAAGEYKCWLNALIQNLETTGFFFFFTYKFKNKSFWFKTL